MNFAARRFHFPSTFPLHGCALFLQSYQFPDPKQHYLVAHGSMLFDEQVPLEYHALKDWVSRQGIEGIVFHCRNPDTGAVDLFKVHQHHLGLEGWGTAPAATRLSRRFLAPHANQPAAPIADQAASSNPAVESATTSSATSNTTVSVASEAT
eukprot:m.206472 g.206472  ORF g.206472 m.206472 type:complete len:152 (+) comp53894_c0_seq1:758-1213(+)